MSQVGVAHLVAMSEMEKDGERERRKEKIIMKIKESKESSSPCSGDSCFKSTQ